MYYNVTKLLGMYLNITFSTKHKTENYAKCHDVCHASDSLLSFCRENGRLREITSHMQKNFPNVLTTNSSENLVNGQRNCESSDKHYVDDISFLIFLYKKTSYKLQSSIKTDETSHNQKR